MLISGRVGRNGPGKACFDAGCAGIEGVDRASALIVGDTLGSDILGGINAGIKTCWFNHKALPAHPAIPADYEIRSLSELPTLLERI